jgi:hypothetical protein
MFKKPAVLALNFQFPPCHIYMVEPEIPGPEKFRHFRKHSGLIVLYILHTLYMILIIMYNMCNI